MKWTDLNFGSLWSFCTQQTAFMSKVLQFLASFFFNIYTSSLFRILPCICKSVFKRVVPQLFFNLQNFRKCAKSDFFLLSRKLHLLKGLCCSTKLCEHYVHQKIQQSLSSIVQQKSMIPANNDLKIDRGFQANVVS